MIISTYGTKRSAIMASYPELSFDPSRFATSSIFLFLFALLYFVVGIVC